MKSGISIVVFLKYGTVCAKSAVGCIIITCCFNVLRFQWFIHGACVSLVFLSKLLSSKFTEENCLFVFVLFLLRSGNFFTF